MATAAQTTLHSSREMGLKKCEIQYLGVMNVKSAEPTGISGLQTHVLSFVFTLSQCFCIIAMLSVVVVNVLSIPIIPH